MAEVPYDLPSNWIWTTIDEIGQVVTGNTPPRSDKSNFGSYLPWVKPPNLDADEPITLTPEMLSRTGAAKARVLPEGTVLVSSIGLLGKVGLAGKRLATNQQINSIVPYSAMHPKYVYYYCKSPTFRHWLASEASATTVPIVNKNRFSRAPIPLAPGQEQVRITEKLERLLRGNRIARADIQKMLPMVRQFRLSVFAKAFRGELTEHNPDDEPAEKLLEEARSHRAKEGVKKHGSSKRRRAVNASGLEMLTVSQLPMGWAWARFSEITSTQNGRNFPSKFYTNHGIRLLRPGNLQIDGRLIWTTDNTRYLPEKFAEEYREYIVNSNEIIMNLTAQSLKDEFLGRVCLTEQTDRSLLNQRLARIRPKAKIDSRYLFWILKSPLFRCFVDGLESGTLIQHMFTWQLDDFILPLAPAREQVQIVDKIDLLLSMATYAGRRIEAGLKESARFESSILAKAFRGGLVEQDPNDEPASALLERIRAQRRRST